MKPPDPDELLRHCRQSLAMNNAALLAVTFATLDKSLRNGGTLPMSWSRAVSPQPTVVSESEENGPATIIDKRGSR